mmetsp:Transcript_24462/g.72518  ORF Transcript_24462/g.72518 Transcript_24462/m.72518 type:complete len:257 (-) Transcript_24462:221-991(-)
MLLPPPMPPARRPRRSLAARAYCRRRRRRRRCIRSRRALACGLAAARRQLAAPAGTDLKATRMAALQARTVMEAATARGWRRSALWKRSRTPRSSWQTHSAAPAHSTAWLRLWHDARACCCAASPMKSGTSTNPKHLRHRWRQYWQTPSSGSPPLRAQQQASLHAWRARAAWKRFKTRRCSRAQAWWLPWWTCCCLPMQSSNRQLRMLWWPLQSATWRCSTICHPTGLLSRSLCRSLETMTRVGRRGLQRLVCWRA